MKEQKKKQSLLFNVFFKNLLVILSYWTISQINFIIFKHVGILPMPIWPAAALAITFAVYWGKEVVIGLFIGSFLANHFSLGAPIGLAISISILNSVGPLMGGSLIRKKVNFDHFIDDIANLTQFIIISAVMVPLITAFGGITSKLIFSKIIINQYPGQFVRWFMAHCLGTLLFAVPYFLWKNNRVEYDESE
jgi:integral membrane sensor domain MASE1